MLHNRRWNSIDLAVGDVPNVGVLVICEPMLTPDLKYDTRITDTDTDTAKRARDLTTIGRKDSEASSLALERLQPSGSSDAIDSLKVCNRLRTKKESEVGPRRLR